MASTHWGLTVAEWLTILAIVVGPLLAVATQLWMQGRKVKRDQRLWVFSTLMSHRGNFINEMFAQAFNLVDVVFYADKEIRDKRKEFIDVVNGIAGRNMTAEEVVKCRDLIAELLAKMGRELDFDFDHTQIRDTGYYPVGLTNVPNAALAVLTGRANIGVVVREEMQTPTASIPNQP